MKEFPGKTFFPFFFVFKILLHSGQMENIKGFGS
jgi:hypothetical protein